MNRSALPVDSIHLYVDPSVRVRALTLDRAAARVLADEEVGYYIQALARPLEPGDSLRLDFALTYRPRGFGNLRRQTAVVRNGTALDRRLLPIVGYQPHSSCPTARRAAASHSRAGRSRGRRYFHYTTDAPIAFGGSVFSARWAVAEDRWGDVTLQVLHHPSHRFVLDRMMRGMRASLAYYSEQFGPYPRASFASSRSHGTAASVPRTRRSSASPRTPSSRG